MSGGMQETLTSLTYLTDWMRKQGVVHLEIQMAKITLGPEPVVAAPVFDNEGEVVKPVSEPKKVGKDGLTAEQQLDVYNRVIDAEE